jgi:hypothetical protein
MLTILGLIVAIALFMWLVPARRAQAKRFDWSRKHSWWSRRRARSAFEK